MAYRAGRLQFAHRHGNLALYRGEGYAFHSLLIPETHADAPPIDTIGAIWIEAGPKPNGETRLKDAIYTLRGSTYDRDGFARLDFPNIEDEEELTDSTERDIDEFDELPGEDF